MSTCKYYNNVIITS